MMWLPLCLFLLPQMIIIVASVVVVEKSSIFRGFDPVSGAGMLLYGAEDKARHESSDPQKWL
jgi:hypothetical protein